MTIEEAIDYLERCADGLDPYFDNAVSLAIAALRAQKERENPKPLTEEELYECCRAGNAHIWVKFPDGQVFPALVQKGCKEPYAILGDNWVLGLGNGSSPNRLRAYLHKPKEERGQ